MEQRIDFYIMSFGLDPSVVLEMTRTMLEEYKDRRNALNPLLSQMPQMTEEEIMKNKQELRREFLKLMRKDKKKHEEKQRTFVYKAVRAQWLWEKLLLVLDMVADFSSKGALYKKILFCAYFTDDDPMTNEQLADEVEVSDDVIDYRKREAIKLFGLFIWSYASRREQDDIIAGLVDNNTDDADDDDDNEELYDCEEG